MAGKKHPVLTVLIILVVVACLLIGAMALVLHFSGSSSKLAFGDKIGVITIEGTILDSRTILSQIIDFRKEGQIKSIILRIDSPGGGVAPSQEIYREIRRTRTKKKVIASMGSLAASGGYYIASAADKIVANPGTLTGSIGVIMQFVHVEELMDRLGLGVEVLKSGEFKDLGSPHRSLSNRERALLESLVQEINEQFVAAVAEGRDMSQESVRAIADGRILSGEQAKDLGLVDLLGNFRDAVELAREMGGIEGDFTLVYPRKPRKGIWDVLLKDVSNALTGELSRLLSPRLEYRWKGPS